MTTLARYRAAVDRLLALKNIEVPWNPRLERNRRTSMRRLRQLLARLGNPERRLRFIHVTGTSGKGSVTSLIHDMLRADGRSVGSYFSPHTTTYLERIRVNDALIHPDDLVAAITTTLDAYEAHVHDGYSCMTFFELSVAITFVALRAANVDWCVLEVGCGGRWDSTNVIPAPAVAVITNIDLDHTQYLGTTREAIAREKAGIIKRGAVVVTGESRRALRTIFAREAKHAGAHPPLYVAPRGTDHQEHNARVAAAAAGAVGVPPETIARVQKTPVALPCRLETISTRPHVIIDGAHNAAKMRATVRYIARNTTGRVHVVFGCKSAKDAKGMLTSLSRIATTIRVTRYEHGAGTPQNPHALSRFVAKRTFAGIYLFPDAAVDAALHDMRRGDVLLITGSLYLAGELRARWIAEADIVRHQQSTLLDAKRDETYRSPRKSSAVSRVSPRV